MKLMKAVVGLVAFAISVVPIAGRFQVITYDLNTTKNLHHDSHINITARSSSVNPLLPRTATVDVAYWDQMVQKGCQLLAGMNNPDVADSSFKDPADLEKWGYTIEEYAEDDCARGMAPIDIDSFKQYGWNPRVATDNNGPNVCIGHRHDEETEHNGIEYPPTNAEFWSVINADDGIFIGWRKYGPITRAPWQNPPVKEIPDLKFWSDVAFLQWKAVTSKLPPNKANKLKAFISAGVKNPETMRLVAAALLPADNPQAREKAGLFNEDKECEGMEWGKRRRFEMDSEEGKALLGSPNGRGAGLFLMQHKSVFGKQSTVSAVEVWCYKGAPDNDSDSEEDEDEDEDEEMEDPDERAKVARGDPDEEMEDPDDDEWHWALGMMFHVVQK